MQTVFILGPSLDSLIEPGPATPPVVPVPGRRGVIFADKATDPGGIVHLKIQPEVTPGDVLPVTVYAYYCNPPSSVPAPADRTADWFMKSGAPSGSVSVIHGPDLVDITVPGVTPGVYHLQTILEYPA